MSKTSRVFSVSLPRTKAKAKTKGPPHHPLSPNTAVKQSLDCQSFAPFYVQVASAQASLGLSPKPAPEYTCIHGFKLHPFCRAQRHHFGKDPQCSLSLLQVISHPSFS